LGGVENGCATGSLRHLSCIHAAPPRPATRDYDSVNIPATHRQRDRRRLGEDDPENDAVSSSDHSTATAIIRHLLELKERADLGPKNVVNPHDIQDVENMLEAYSLQADYLLAQLNDLSKDLDDFQVRRLGGHA
jgi:hypothetical protein